MQVHNMSYNYNEFPINRCLLNCVCCLYNIFVDVVI